MADIIYNRTELGERAMRGQAGQIAPDLVRVLALVSGDTHFDLVKKRAIRMPEADLKGVLERLVSAGLIAARTSTEKDDLDFTMHFSTPVAETPVLTDSEKKRLGLEASSAKMA